MKNVLITRPKEQAQEIVYSFEQEGFNTFVEPLFYVKKIDQKNVTKKLKAYAIIITSANACDAVINFNFDKEIKIYAVGKKTAKKLIEKGYKNIIFPPEKTAASLKDLIIKSQKETGKILYFRGSISSIDFKKELKKLGFDVEEIFAYSIIEVKHFSDEFLQFCQKNYFNYVLIFSQNSAKIFAKLARNHNLLEYFLGAQILCLSEKILNDVRNFGFKNSKTFNEFPILRKFYD